MDMETSLIGRQVKGLGDVAGTELDLWPDIDIGALDEISRSQFLKRKNAVLLYLAGASDADLRKQCGIGVKQVYRLITERCIVFHADGSPQGWRGLIRGKHINGYNRTKSVKVNEWGNGASGVLTLAFQTYPKIRRDFDRRILQAASQLKLSESKKPKQALWRWLIGQFKAAGMEVRCEWPFTTKHLGYRSICTYIERVLEGSPELAAKAFGGPELAKKMVAGSGVDRPILRPFQRVEVDAHKLDGRFCVMIPQLDGDVTPKLVHRLWVVVILEVLSKAVLGYYFSLGREVSKSDVLLAIKASLTPWRRKKLSFDGNSYSPHAALPSGHSEKFIGICYDEFSVDGALANTCQTVETQLQDIVGAQLLTPTNSYAARRSKDDRPYIERFFSTLSKRGFQRMSNTTGGKAAEGLGKMGESVALTSQFQYEYAEELIDVLIANYNATPHTSLGHRSPLEYLDYLSGKESFLPRYADRQAVSMICSTRKLCTVKGGYRLGRRPYINFESARYSADWLDRRQDLVGTKIWAINDDEFNACVIMVSSIDGEILGHLRAHPPWHITPHSLRVRRAINSLASRRLIHLASNVDAIQSFIEYAEANPGKKLPLHPAYLEARQAIVREYQSVIEQTESVMTNLAANELTTPSSVFPRGESSSLKDRAATAPASSGERLPTRRQTVVK